MKLILIGAGNRGMETYAHWIKLNHPDVQFVAMADPNINKRLRFSHEYNVPLESCYESWETLLENEKMADAAIIATQDFMHYEPTMKALSLGYHVLLEKPISGSKKELIALREHAKAQKKILSIAHVLRYSDFFGVIKHLLDEKIIGDLKSIQHEENIAYYHYAHSFVRGPWHRSDLANPIILAKACHDMDLMAWYVDSKCLRVSSFGAQNTLIPKNRPKGAPDRCGKHCPHAATCPYEVHKLYQQDKALHLAKIIKNEYGSLEKGLAESDYGRCVYSMDNDVMETQTTLLEFENGIHVSFHLSAFTDEISRYLHLNGTEGEIRGNTLTRSITVKRYDELEERFIQIGESDSMHEGGDAGIVKGFIEEVMMNKIEDGRTSIDKSIMSHLMSLAAESSRKTHRVIEMDAFEKEME
jgi:Oxidoreductase family, NAD-binding Rossmann fold